MTALDLPIGTPVQPTTVHVPAPVAHTVVSAPSSPPATRPSDRVSWRAWIVGDDGQPL